MESVKGFIEQATNDGKKIYIRGFSDFGFNLSICLGSMQIDFEGYYDIDNSKIGQLDYKGRKCYSPEDANEECVVLCVIQNEKAKNAIAEELSAKNIGYIFVSTKQMEQMIRTIDDEDFLKEYYLMIMGKPLNIDAPKTLCEKLQWLKLYDRNPLYTKLADKYDVRKYVADTIGEEYLVPNCGVWDSFDDIDFDSLPDQFVLKCTNNSGCFVVVKDKHNFDREKAREILENGLKTNYFYQSREWVYKNIPPRIIADQYIASLGNLSSIEYKMHCYNGKVDHVEVERGINHNTIDSLTLDAFDRDFNKLDYTFKFKNSSVELTKPVVWEKMVELSEKLAKGITNVRVDFYVDEGKILFSEMTFYTWSGFMKFEPEEWDRKLGDRLILPDKKILE